MLRFVTCGPVIQEVLQGLRPGIDSDAFREAFLAIPVVSDPLSPHLFLSAADIYSQGRRRGLTTRSSIDCLIAAVALDRNLTVWHHDRDFDTIARYTALRTLQR